MQYHRKFKKVLIVSQNGQTVKELQIILDEMFRVSVFMKKKDALESLKQNHGEAAIVICELA